MSKKSENKTKNIKKPGKIRQIYRKNVKNFEKPTKTAKNIKNSSKM